MLNTSGYASLAAGVSMAAYGGYQYWNIPQPEENEAKEALAYAAQQKQKALMLMAAGTASAAAGLGMLYFGSGETSQPQISPYDKDLAIANAETTTNSIFGKFFSILSDDQKREFHLPANSDGTVNTANMTKLVAWGSAQHPTDAAQTSAPYFGVNYQCDLTKASGETSSLNTTSVFFNDNSFSIDKTNEGGPCHNVVKRLIDDAKNWTEFFSNNISYTLSRADAKKFTEIKISPLFANPPSVEA